MKANVDKTYADWTTKIADIQAQIDHLKKEYEFWLGEPYGD